jgi:choline dehydrogenase-like flavoprotein
VLHRAALEGVRIAVWLHANAVGVEMDGERITGVRTRTFGGKDVLFEAEEYVFCLGAIESSRFFLQPRDGGLPWNVSGLLGTNFQDHIDSNAATVRVKDRRRFHERFDNIFLGGFKYHPKIKLSEQAQRECGTLNAGATMYFVSEMDEQLDRLKATAKKVLGGRIGEVSAKDIAILAQNLPLLVRQGWRYKAVHRAYNPKAAKIQLRVHCEQEPQSASSISLCDERDSLGLLRTRLDWHISDAEQKTIREFAQIAKRELADIAEIDIDAQLAQGDPAYRLRCDDSNHHMGGMRMGTSANEGVVDPNLRLHGTKNCYVCSGAVFPTSGFSNPTHTVLALAARLAEYLNR